VIKEAFKVLQKLVLCLLTLLIQTVLFYFLIFIFYLGPSNITIAAYFVGNDDRKNLERRLGPLFEQLKELCKIYVCGLQIELLISADYKFLCSFFGHRGASAKHPCILCKAERPLPLESAEERTFPLGLHDHLHKFIFYLDGFSIQVGKLPLLPIDLKNVTLPIFHILHGLGQRIMDILEKMVVEAGNEIKLVEWLKKIHCKRRKRAQNYSGYFHNYTHCRNTFRK